MDQPDVEKGGSQRERSESDLNTFPESYYRGAMLVALSINNIVLIDKLTLNFGPGLSVLTGETGAGKSILLDAFALALGARGDAALVRQGFSQGQVVAEFDITAAGAVRDILAHHHLDAEDTLILRRIQQSDGRTRAFINDQPVSVQLLRLVGSRLVEIHGQHEERALTDSRVHRRLLDAYGGLTGEADTVRTAWEHWRELQARLEEEEAALAHMRENADYLRHTLDELERLAPQPGEEEELAARRQMMMSAEKIAEEMNAALDCLAGDNGAEAQINGALRRLERHTATAGALVEPLIEALERVLAEAGEAREALERALHGTEFSPEELEQTEERLFALRALARKHRVPVDELPSLQEKFAHSLEQMADAEARLAQLRREAGEAAATYWQVAKDLSAKRRAAAARLDKAVMAELAPLKLEKARFITHLQAIDGGAEGGCGPGGLERVNFHVQTNPGTEAGPLMKVASGGELSRFILALKVVLAERGSAPTLIFDEIDTGVGGATASAIGDRLARLAEKVQVLAVTHAPQVAAHASGHMRITKEAVPSERGEEAVVTRVATLDETGRREEIARMLAGAVITDEARAAAGRLIGSRV